VRINTGGALSTALGSVFKHTYLSGLHSQKKPSSSQEGNG